MNPPFQTPETPSGTSQWFSCRYLPQQLIDLVLPAAKVSTLHEVVDLLPPPTSRSVHLKWPQEVGSILLVDQILKTDDTELTLDDAVGR